MPLLAASMTNDPRLIAGLATRYALVRLLVALPVGVWVDRFDRPTFIVVANILRGIALLGLKLTNQFGLSSLVLLYSTMAIVATFESLAQGGVTLGGLALTTNPIIAGVLLALYILHAFVWNICSLSLRQRLVPDNLFGRVNAAARVIGLLGLSIGSALGGSWEQSIWRFR